MHSSAVWLPCWLTPIKNELGCKVRGIELSLLQRCAAHCASKTDVDESYMSGKAAVENAVAGKTDYMPGFKCTRDENGYKCEIELLPAVSRLLTPRRRFRVSGSTRRATA